MYIAFPGWMQPMADEYKNASSPTSRWLRPLTLVYLIAGAAFAVLTSPWWGWVLGGALWSVFVAVQPYRVTITNHAAEPVVSGQFEAYGRSHDIGRIAAGGSRTLWIWAPWDHDTNEARLTFASGRMLRAADQPYAPYFWQHYRWTVDASGTVVDDQSGYLTKLDASGRFLENQGSKGFRPADQSR